MLKMLPLVALLCGCVAAPAVNQQPDPVEPDVIGATDTKSATGNVALSPVVAAPWRWRDARYSQVAEMALRNEGGDLIFAEPADAELFCPAWPQLNAYERMNFWADLLAAMADFESSHNPTAKHTERFNDRFGQPVVSRGLLQLSQESANGYGCNIERAEQLHNPAENIRCAVRIMQRWVVEDGVISSFVEQEERPWRGGARYWSVLRGNHKTAAIQQNLRSTRLCRGNSEVSAAY